MVDSKNTDQTGSSAAAPTAIPATASPQLALVLRPATNIDAAVTLPTAADAKETTSSIAPSPAMSSTPSKPLDRRANARKQELRFERLSRSSHTSRATPALAMRRTPITYHSMHGGGGGAQGKKSVGEHIVCRAPTRANAAMRDAVFALHRDMAVGVGHATDTEALAVHNGLIMMEFGQGYFVLRLDEVTMRPMDHLKTHRAELLEKLRMTDTQLAAKTRSMALKSKKFKLCKWTLLGALPAHLRVIENAHTGAVFTCTVVPV